MCSRVNPSTLEWIRKPSLFIFNADKIVFETEPYTSFHINPKKNTAYGLKGKPRKEFRIDLRMDYNFKHKKDECGLFIEFDQDHWLTFGVERISDEANRIFVRRVVHNEMDESNREIASGITYLLLKMKYQKRELHLQYGFNEDRYWDIRKIQLEDQPMGTIGIYGCSENQSYFDCTFSSINVSDH